MALTPFLRGWVAFISPTIQRAQGTLGLERALWSRVHQSGPHLEGLSLCFALRRQLVW